MNIEIISRIIPKNGQNFPVVEDKYVHGGFHVATYFADISMESRKEGMLVYLQGDGKYYKLLGGLDDGYWTEVTIAASNSFIYEGSVLASSDGYLLTDSPFLTEVNKVYSLGIYISIASTESDNSANFYYNMSCRDQAGVIVIDSVNEISSYDLYNNFTVNFITNGLTNNLIIQLENVSVEEVVARAVIVKQNEISRL